MIMTVITHEQKLSLKMITWFVCFFIAQISCQQNYLILDQVPTGYTVTESEICNAENECYPLYFEPTNEFQIVQAGQRVPKGLHIAMDYQSNLKKAKLLDRSEAGPSEVDVVEERSESNLLVENEPETVIIPHEPRNVSSLTMEEVNTLDLLFSKMNSTEPRNVTEVLDILSDAVHQIDIGAGLTASEKHVEFLVYLVHHQDSQICSKAALVLGTAVSNNPMAQQNVMQVDDLLERLLKRFAGLPTGICKTRLLFLLTSLTRNPEILPQFLVFDALHFLLTETKDSPTLLLKLIRYMIDILPLLQETDINAHIWCEKLESLQDGSEEFLSEAQQLLGLLQSFPNCQRKQDHDEL
jgi:nucleotide exchange factor SIL1